MTFKHFPHHGMYIKSDCLVKQIIIILHSGGYGCIKPKTNHQLATVDGGQGYPTEGKVCIVTM